VTDFKIGPEFCTHTYTYTHVRASVCHLKDVDLILFFKKSSGKVAEVSAFFFPVC